MSDLKNVEVINFIKKLLSTEFETIRYYLNDFVINSTILLSINNNIEHFLNTLECWD